MFEGALNTPLLKNKAGVCCVKRTLNSKEKTSIYVLKFKFMNLFCLITFSFNYFRFRWLFHFVFFLVKVICYLWCSKRFKNETSLTLQANSEAYSKPLTALSFKLFWQKAPSEMFRKILSSPLKREVSCGKSSVSDYSHGFEFVFVAINYFRESVGR